MLGVIETNNWSVKILSKKLIKLMDGLKVKPASNKNLKNLKIKNNIRTNKIEVTENKKMDKNSPLILAVNIQKLLTYQFN